MVYVGATRRHPDQRFVEHRRDALRFKHRPLYAAINKYGIENFSLDVIEECDLASLSEREEYWIEKCNSFADGYNSTIGGAGKRFADYNLIFSLWAKGLNLKEIQETTSYDYNTIKNALELCGVSTIERKNRGNLVGCKHVAMLDPQTHQTIVTFPNIGMAYAKLGKQQSGHIADVCTGKRKTAYG